ncbi:hypothetical protein ACKWTF_014730 [Chironomus riparius]
MVGSKLYKDDSKHSNPILPIEMILNIISQVTNFKDKLNCMLLSKDIRDVMFKSPKLMRGINFRFNSATFDDWRGFMVNRGLCMRNVVIELLPNIDGIMRNVLMMLANIEELELRRNKNVFGEYNLISSGLDGTSGTNDYKEVSDQGISLKTLKSLKINTKDIQQFLKITKNVKNLKTLTILYDSPKDEDSMYDLICQPQDLQHLTILNVQKTHFVFPNSDITKKIKFNLKTFKLNISHFTRENENLAKFLAVHAATLEELDFDFSIHPKVCKVVAIKLTKLVKLIHRSDIFSPIYTNYFQNRTIKHLHDKNPTDLYFPSISQRFQCLEHLKCQSVSFSPGTADCLKTLDVDILDLENLRNFEMPNLENLIVNDFSMIFMDALGYLNSAIPKNFHLTIRNIQSDKTLAAILRNMNLINKLITLNVRAEPFKVVVQNLTIRVDDWFFSIKFDCDEKMFKVTTHTVEKCKKIYSFMADLLEMDLYKFKFDLVGVDEFCKVV